MQRWRVAAKKNPRIPRATHAGQWLFNGENVMNHQQKKRNGFGPVAVLTRLEHLVLSVLLLTASSAFAQEKSADQWQYDFQVYLWGATMKNTTVTGDSTVINFGTILSNLDFVVMTTLGARKDKFSMLADIIYMDLSDTQTKKDEFLGYPVTGKFKVNLNSWVLNLIGGYNLVDNDKNVFDIAGGARYLDLEVESVLKVGGLERKVGGSDQLWDGVVGFKGRHYYPDGYYFNYYADVGGGESKLTWQAVANFAYDYSKFTGIVGYRYLKWDFGHGSDVLDDLVIHGPYVSAKWSF
jgi:hypothetical protein